MSECTTMWMRYGLHFTFLARLHFRTAIAIPPVSVSASASASASKMLGQMLKSWNFSLSVFSLAF